jgi:histidinol-phosphate/aromatic aminotransferase/cobyric acid decarboxylase-like protein
MLKKRISNINLSSKELELREAFKSLKDKSGTHSPSVYQIVEIFNRKNDFVDACFLSNPYATDLFFSQMKFDLLDHDFKIRALLEYYPSQNYKLAGGLSKFLEIDYNRLFIGNGATEVIQAVLHNFVTKIVVIIPTFSPYYEFVKDLKSVVYYPLKKENNFTMNPDDYIDFVLNSGADSVIIINPNNPDGSFIEKRTLIHIINRLTKLKSIIIDESFIHFTSNADINYDSVLSDSKSYSNLIIIKSMSKDFGIAGIRAGYAVMSKERVNKLLANGYLWNSNGLAEYFFNLLSNVTFVSEYEVVRKKYNALRDSFISALNDIKGIRVYPSKANFVLVELVNGSKSIDLVVVMLNRYGIYLRSGNDKIGLDGEFIRVAIRDLITNNKIIFAFRDLYGINS